VVQSIQASTNLMVRIVHFSDWHCQFNKLPEGDVYVCTGDMLDNYPDMVKGFDAYGRRGYRRKIVREKEERLQTDWFERKFTQKGKQLGLRHFFPKCCKHNPVVVVRGNHDFIDLGPLFGGEVFEISHDPTRSVEYCGLRFGGFRGIPLIAFEWSDEIEQCDFDVVVDRLPDDLDVVVTHAPPWGIRDYCGEHIGINALARWATNRQYTCDKKPRLYCFGHCHSGLGKTEYDGGNVIFSNAACGKQVIEID